MSRLVIYTKDVEHILGKKERAARSLIRKIRQDLGKPKDMPLTVNDFCKVTQMDVELVLRMLR